MLVGLFLAADWALVVVLNKRLLAFFEPLPLNLVLRVVTLGALLGMTVPMTVLGWWDLGFGLSAGAAGYIAVSAVITWVFAFNAYYSALRKGRASVVAPVTATDPIWAALFAPLVLGAGLDPLVVAGLVVATAGVALIAHWTSRTAGELPEAAGVPAPAAVVPAAGAERAPAGVLSTVTLAAVAAAGWGLGPVIIEAAENLDGGASAGMMVLSHLLGVLLVGGMVLIRRGPFLTAPLSGNGRRVVLLLLASGVLEALFAVLYYLTIEVIGAVLTLLLGATSPLFTIVGSAVILKERVDRRLIAASLVTMGGVVIAILARVV